MKFIYDSREKLALTEYLSGLGQCSSSFLKTGDYSIEGYEDDFAVERKTLHDFISSVTTHRARFEREMQRGAKMKFFAVVVECDYADIRNKNYPHNVEPQAILGTWLAWIVRYNVPILFVGNREGAALAVYKFALEFLKNERNK